MNAKERAWVSLLCRGLWSGVVPTQYSSPCGSNLVALLRLSQALPLLSRPVARYVTDGAWCVSPTDVVIVCARWGYVRPAEALRLVRGLTKPDVCETESDRFFIRLATGVKFLQGDCDNLVLRVGATHGHLNFLKWLHTSFRLKPDDLAANEFEVLQTSCQNGWLGIAQWAASLGDLALPTWGISRSAETRDKHCPVLLSLRSACLGGHISVVHWLVSHYSITFNDVEEALDDGGTATNTFAELPPGVQRCLASAFPELRRASYLDRTISDDDEVEDQGLHPTHRPSCLHHRSTRTSKTSDDSSADEGFRSDDSLSSCGTGSGEDDSDYNSDLEEDTSEGRKRESARQQQGGCFSSKRRRL
ncbi:hypothetical protein Pelo_1121 [Pelomyxa schiedti]|nr:hypothetical protein Pelo_1121 [Pelomyxa schiedti]